MLDFHTHILPGIDDGSRDVKTSCEMIKMLSNQGVDAFVATPHFRFDEMSFERFLSNRNKSVQQLLNALEEENIKERPKLSLGAEVRFFYGMNTFDHIDKLCIKGTRFILIEMPFRNWTREMYHTLASLKRNREIIPVIAHIERYLSFNARRAMVMNLQKTGALIQANTAFFKSGLTRTFAFDMMKDGFIQFIGTDCHNLDKRKPDFDDAVKYLSKKKKGLYLDDLRFWESAFFDANPELL